MSINGDGICPGEKTRQSASSPGIVDDGEMLARIVLIDRDITADGKLDKSALKITEFVSPGNGWSFVRQKFAEMQSALKRHAKGKTRQYSEYGYVSVATSDVRGVLDGSGGRSVCVIDDAQADFDEHALARPSQESLNESGARKVRMKLLKKFSGIKREI